jgi:N-acetylglutamate synthase-like GNAT family acetyltransferase
MISPSIPEANSSGTNSLVTSVSQGLRENRELEFPAEAETVTEEELTDSTRDSREFVAEHDGRMIGGIRIESSNQDCLKIRRFAVHPDWQGAGIGSALMDRVEQLA